MYKNILPGVLLIENAIDFSDKDIETFNNVLNNKKFQDMSKKTDIKNILWNCFYDTENLELIKNIQKTILFSLAEYVNKYKESIYSLQWQERIYIYKHLPGESQQLFNPLKSLEIENNIPYNRSIVVEIQLEDKNIGDSICWEYFKDNSIKLSKGSILIYPASFLYTNTRSTIIDGEGMFLRTFFNGGKDFISENESLDGFENIYMFSYMR